MLKLPAYGSWRVKTLEGATFERLDTPPELAELALRATRAMGMTLAGLDILPTPDGYVVLEVNPVAGFLNIFGGGPAVGGSTPASTTGSRSTPAERSWGHATDGAGRERGVAGGGRGLQRLPGRAGRVPAARRPRVRDGAPAAQPAAGGGGRRGAGDARAPGPLRRPQPAAAGAGAARRRAGAAGARAAGGAGRGAGAGRAGDAGRAYELHDLAATTAIGPFAVRTVPLPHFVPNLGVRLDAGGAALAYTGDAAPDDALVDLARDADVLLAEASFVDTVPERQRAG